VTHRIDRDATRPSAILHAKSSWSLHADTSCSGSSCDSDDTDSMTNLDDLVLSAGAGGGVQIGLGQVPHRVRLDLSVRYLYGGEARYLAEGWIPCRAPSIP